VSELVARGRRSAPQTVACLLVTGYVATFCLAMRRYDYDVWGAFLVGPVLVAVTVPLLLRLSRDDPDPRLPQLLVLAFLVKMVATLGRYWMAFGLYGGASDSARYARDASPIADQLRAGVFTFDTGIPLIGTGFVILLTGVVYAVTGPTLIGAFLVFGWLSFWGQYLFYRAFRVGFPAGDHYRYGVLVFLLPSILFWPSSIGKDAWMLLSLGMTAYGVARLLERLPGALPWLAAGTTGTVLVRPHVAMLIFVALLVGYALRRRPDRLTALGPVKSIITVVVLAAAGLLVLRQVSAFLGTDPFGDGAIDQTLTNTQHRTSGAGSDYATPAVGSPLRLPMGVVTVLFRPFPFEAHNVASLIASVEGLGLLALVAVSLPRLRAALRSLRRHSYNAVALVYTLLFCFAFSSFANFGILTRERVQVFPFVLVLLAAPAGPRRPTTPRPLGSALLSRRSPTP
jgi:hypothetical protein